MNDSQRRKLEKFERETNFVTDNSADFPANSPGGLNAAALIALLEEIREKDAMQISGTDDARQRYFNLSVAEDNLRDDLEAINIAAAALGDEVPGIEEKFRLSRSQSKAALLAKARSFHTDADAVKAKLIEVGLPANFLTDLSADIDAFINADAAADSAVDKRTEATAALEDAFKRGMKISKKLDSNVRLKYRNNPAKLAAWTMASHLERAARSSPAQGRDRILPQPDTPPISPKG